MTPNMRAFLHVVAIALAAAAILVASNPAEAHHSSLPCRAISDNRAMSIRTLVRAHACSCSSVNFVMTESSSARHW
jgi:hypothetical protein